MRAIQFLSALLQALWPPGTAAGNGGREGRETVSLLQAHGQVSGQTHLPTLEPTPPLPLTEQRAPTGGAQDKTAEKSCGKSFSEKDVWKCCCA